MEIHPRRLTIGMATIGLGVVFGVGKLGADRSQPFSEATRAVVEHLLESEPEIELASTPFPLQREDPVFANVGGTWRLVGVVSEAPGVAQPGRLRLLDDDWYIQSGSEAEYYRTPQDFAWVAQVMLPQDKREQLTQNLLQRFREHQGELLADMEPFLRQSVADLAPLIQERIQASLEAQRPKLQEIAERYQVELIEEKLVPLIKEEIMPIVKAESLPLLSQIGEELFERVSVWGFAWRFLYDRSPLPQRDLVRKKFEQFVEEDAVPIIEGHTEDILEMVLRIVKEVAMNAQVKRFVRESAEAMFHDPELRELVNQTVQDVFTDVAPLREAMRRNWEGPAGRQLVATLQSWLEPWLRKAGEELLGTPEEGLTPELVAVLRSQILAKDQRWLVIRIEPRVDTNRVGSAIPVIAGMGTPRYPMLLEASGR